jgi:hypothetical protein
MNYLSVFVAGFAYFALGGLWFTPLFGKQWDKAVGFERPEKWRPSTIYYVGPLVGSFVGAFVIAVIMNLSQSASLTEALSIGFLVGIVGATVTTVNAISPNTPRPGLYALVTGGYHLTGLVLCSVVIYLLS